MNVFEKVAEIIANHTDTPVADITMEASFEEIGLDSLDIVDLVMAMEDTFSVKIELSQSIKKVGDLVTVIESLKQ